MLLCQLSHQNTSIYLFIFVSSSVADTMASTAPHPCFSATWFGKIIWYNRIYKEKHDTKFHKHLEYWYPVTFCEKLWCCLVCFISSSSTRHRLVLIWLRSIWGLTSHHEPPRIKHGTSNMKDMYLIPVVGLQKRSPTMSTPFSEYKWVVFVVFNAELFSLE